MENDKLVEFLTKFIVESDAIENITDDPEVVRRELFERKAGGHVCALVYLDYLARSPANHYLSHADIQFVQRLIVSEQHLKPGGKWLPERDIGVYRGHGVVAGGKWCLVDGKWHLIDGRWCMDPRDVPAAMDELLKIIRKWQENARSLGPKENIEQIADFHFAFEIIHPFADGNGRTGRALAYFLFLCAAMQPFIFTSSDKRSAYYPCFKEETPQRMREYFLARCAFPASGHNVVQ